MNMHASSVAISETVDPKKEQSYRLMHGDCLELMKELPDASVDMILCDLPYGTTACKWDSVIPFEPLWEQYKRIAKPNAAIVLFGAEPFSSHLRLSNLKLFKYDIIWDKVKGTGFLNAKRQVMRNHEIISVFYKRQCTYNPQKTTGHNLKKSSRGKHLHTDVYGQMNNDCVYESTERYPRSIQVFSPDTQNSPLHPTQKPVALCEWLIRTYTNGGDLVLDNCMGSGTTGVACINTERRFIGIEQDDEYFNVATERMATTQIMVEAARMPQGTIPMEGL